MTTSARRNEDGDTLIEVLLAIVILGIASVALLLAFGTTISGSGTHRQLSTMDTVLKTATDATITQMTQSSTVFGSCTGAGTVSFTGLLPSGYTAQVTQVTYWNGSSFTSTCTPNTSTSYSVTANSPRLVTITVTYNGTTSVSISAVVDNPLSPTPPTLGAATHLVFLSQPGNEVSGTTFLPQPVVAIEDSNNNIVTSDLSPVGLAVTSGTGTGGAALAGCTATAYYGVVNFSNCTIVIAGSGYTLTASDAGLASATSPIFNVTPGPAAQVVFTTQPGNASGGTAFGIQPVVTVEDAGGNTVTTDGSSIVLAITTGSGTAGAAFNCLPTNAASAVNGVASFLGCTINRSGTNYTLTATDTGLTSATSTTFNVSVGPAAQLAVLSSPGNSTAGTAFGNQPAAVVEDAGGNTVTSSSAPIALAITSGTGTAGASLTCPSSNPLNAVSGLAAFTGCSINAAGVGYTLTASSAGLTSATTNAFTITAGPPSKFVIISAPVSGPASASATLGPITVQEQDALGNPTTTVETVTLSSNSSGTAKFSASSGGAFTTTVSIPGGSSSANFYYADTKAGSPTITVSGPLSNATQSESIAGGPGAQLVFSPLSPGPGTAGSAIPNVGVQVQDAFGNTATTTGSVTLTIKVGSPQAGFTSGTASATLSGGFATFSDLVVNASGSYTLTATPSGIAGVTNPVNSSAFTVAPAAASSFSVANPGSQTAGVAFGDTITALDAYGNVATGYTGAKSVVFSGPSNGPTTGAPTYPATVTFAAGVGTASGITLVNAQSTTLTATQGTVAGTSSAFTVAPAAASSFSVANPGSQTAGVAFGDTITALDAYGNVATGYTGAKSVVFSGPSNGPTTGAPTYPATVTFAAGVGTASGITLVNAQSTTLKATVGTVNGTSSAFTVAPAAASSFSVANPGSQTAGVAFGDTITALDAYGNVATGYTGAKSVVFSGPSNGPTTGAPTYPATVTFASGVGTASGITLVNAQSTTLTATQGTVAGTSSAFTVAPAAASSFSVANPGSQTAGVAFGDTITALDAYGNVATSYTGAKSVVFSGPSNGPTTGAPTYPATVTFASGVGTASGITLVNAQSTTLTATQGTVAGTSSAFTVAPAAASSFSVANPGSQTAGVAFGDTITALDAYGNVATGYTGAKSVVFSGPSNGPTTGAPTYPATVTFASGVGTASGITLVNAQTTTLKATVGTVNGTSTAFTVSGGTLNTFSVPTPSAQTAGTAFLEAITALDVYGNAANGWTSVTNCVTFSGLSGSPSYPAPGSCGAGNSSLTFNAAGQATGSITPVAIQTASLTVTSVSNPLGKTGASGPFIVSGGLTLSPSNGTVGTTGVTLSGSGFTPGKTISVTFAGSALTLNPVTPTVSGTGTWSATFTVPASTNGAKTISATDSGGANATTTFTVNAGLTVSPANATVGTTGVTLSGTGYVAGKTVNVSTGVTFGGSALTISGTQTVSGTGTWSATFTVPASTNGAKTISATDSGGANATTTFTVNAGLTVSPASGRVGATGVTLNGTGYVAGATVNVSTGVTFGGSALTISGTQTVSGTGTWSATFTVPASTNGAKTISATDSGGANATTTFTVNAGLTVSPASGRVGATGVTLNGTGYVAGATVNVSTGVTFGGSALTISGTQTVSGTGTWSATFTVPASTIGAKTISATDSGGANATATYTVGTFAATDLGNNGASPCTNLGNSRICGGPSVSTTSGNTDLIFVFVSGSGESGTTVSSVSGPFNGAVQLTSSVVGSVGERSFVYAWAATGTGSTASVSATFDGTIAKRPTGVVIDVVELGPGDTVVTNGTNAGTGTIPVVGLSVSSSSDSEVAFEGYDSNETNTLPGFTLLDKNNSGSGFGYGTYSNPTVAASTSGTLASSAPWGTIAIEVNP